MNDFSACRTSTGEEEQEECAGIDGEGPDGNVEGKRKTTAWYMYGAAVEKRSDVYDEIKETEDGLKKRGNAA